MLGNLILVNKTLMCICEIDDTTANKRKSRDFMQCRFTNPGKQIKLSVINVHLMCEAVADLFSDPLLSTPPLDTEQQTLWRAAFC